MKKILFVNSCLSSGGSEKVMTLLANQFYKMGYDVTMVLLREKPKSYFVADGVKLVEFHYTNKSKVFIALQRLLKLRALIKNGHYEVVVSFMFDINLTTLISCLGINVPIFISERADPQNRGVSRLYEKIENFFYNRAAGLILQTEQVKDFYAKRVKTPLYVIPNPIVIDRCPYLGKREKKVVAVGRLSEQKNFHMLINAFEEFGRNFQEYTLDIYGEGPLKDSLVELTKKLGIENRVNFKGYVTSIPEKIENAAMYVSTSNYEGISNSMLEAMAMGLPTICTDCPVGGAALVIDDGVNGFLIPLNDKAKLVENLTIFATDRELCTRLSLNAIKVRERFAVERIADEWKKMMER